MELNMCKSVSSTTVAAATITAAAIANVKSSNHNERAPPPLKSITNVSDENSDSKDAMAAVSTEKKYEIKSEIPCTSSKAVTELLGSVTIQNCPGTRTSARVIQKLKQDQTRPSTPPPNERDQHKKDDKNTLKTTAQVRTQKSTWTNLERDYFFDALNEFGKDFEALGNCINSKLKRRNTSDTSFKTKEQVRQHYYQTYHKIAKYIRFSEEIKKPVQELYVLINYGEMRRKLQFLTEKHFLKVRQLIYEGHTTVRCKGKNIKIKTPSCKALRRINQLDDALEDIRLPAKIDVVITPANMESFGRVQAVAQNPHVRTTVPLHKKLSSFIKTFQYKWRSANAKLAEEELKLFPPSTVTVTATTNEMTESTAACLATQRDGEICFLPKPGVQIHRPVLSINEYLSSMNICLAAYEERMGVKIRSETLNQERNNNANAKRQRTESGSDKRSPEAKRIKSLNSPLHEKLLDEAPIKDEANILMTHIDDVIASTSNALVNVKSSSSDELNDEINDLLNDILAEEEEKNDLTSTSNSATIANLNQARNKKGNVVASTVTIQNIANNTGTNNNSINCNNTKSNSRVVPTFKPLLSDDVLRNIRKGWTISNALDITIGDLYVAMGQDSKLELDYYWKPVKAVPIAETAALTINCEAANELETVTKTREQQDAIPSCSNHNNFGVTALAKPNNQPYNPYDSEDIERLKTLNASSINNKLKHLLLIANLSERVRRRQCHCGHSCDRNATKTRFDLANKTYNKTSVENSAVTATAVATTQADNAITTNVFRQPAVPARRPVVSVDPVKQLTELTRQRPVLVKRRLLQPGRAQQNSEVANLKNTSINTNKPKMPNKNCNNNINGCSLTENLCDNNSSDATTATINTINDALLETIVKTTNDDESSNTYQYSNDENNATTSTTWQQSNNSCVNSQAKSMPSLDFNEDSLLSTNIIPSDNHNDSDSNSDSDGDGVGDDDGCDPNDNDDDNLPNSNDDESTTSNFFNGMMSPSQLLRDTSSSSSNSRWLNENVNDYSLTSLLGHLEDINASRDILDPSSSMSVLSENSVDYMHRFQEITALMQSQEKD